jgi:large subunit ribosomal protein L32
MPEPKKQLTKRRQGNRRSQKHGKLAKVSLATCSNCSSKVFPHRVCSNCGFYKGKKIIAKLIS